MPMIMPGDAYARYIYNRHDISRAGDILMPQQRGGNSDMHKASIIISLILLFTAGAKPSLFISPSPAGGKPAAACENDANIQK